MEREKPVKLYAENDGYYIYIYDKANEKIVEPLVTRDWDNDPFHTASPEQKEEIRENGLIVSFEMQQDDDIHARIYCGPPLTEEEIKKIKIDCYGQRYINLPTGKICMGEWPMRAGKAKVPPGEYTLTLYHKRKGGITVTLTPFAELPIEKSYPFLDYGGLTWVD